MNQDFVRTLGHLALGTRFKRLGDRVQQQAQELLATQDIHVPAAQLPLLAAVDRMGSASIGALAQVLGVTQPGVTRLVGKLARAGLLQTGAAEGDRRVRTIRLTPTGQALMTRAKATAWPLMDAAVADLCAAAPGQVLPLLAGLEEALDARPLVRRVDCGKGTP